MCVLYECARIVNGVNYTVGHFVFDVTDNDFKNPLVHQWRPLKVEQFDTHVNQGDVFFYKRIQDGETYRDFTEQGELLKQLPRLDNPDNIAMYIQDYDKLILKFNEEHVLKANNSPHFIACAVKHVNMYMGKPFVSLVCYNKDLQHFMGHLYQKHQHLTTLTRWEGFNVSEIVLPLEVLKDSSFTNDEYTILISTESVLNLQRLDIESRQLWHVNKNLTYASDDALNELMEQITNVNTRNVNNEYPDDYPNIIKYCGVYGFTEENRGPELQRLMSALHVDNLHDLNTEITIFLPTSEL